MRSVDVGVTCSSLSLELDLDYIRVTGASCTMSVDISHEGIRLDIRFKSNLRCSLFNT